MDQITETGFLVRRVFDCDSKTQAALQSELLKEADWYCIFNQKLKRTHRYQRALCPEDRGLQSVFRQVQRECRGLFPDHVPRQEVILKCDAGCVQQKAHCDFPPEDLNRDCRCNPMGCLIAIMPNTKIVLWPKMFSLDDWKDREPVRSVILQLEPGEIFVFRGDLVHAGAAYQTQHFRLHMYLDGPDNRQRKNATWIVRYEHQQTHPVDKIIE